MLNLEVEEGTIKDRDRSGLSSTPLRMATPTRFV